MTGRLLHLNGAPGAGKSTLARAVVASRPGWLCLDIDVLRQLVGGWEDHAATGTLVRPLALAMISAHLAGGRDVVLPQLLVDPAEVERFVAAARDVGGSYTGVLLDLPDDVVAARWRQRDVSEPVTAANNRVIATDGGDAVVLDRARRLRGAYAARSDVTVIDLAGLDTRAALGLVAAAIDRDARTEPGPAGVGRGDGMEREYVVRFTPAPPLTRRPAGDHSGLPDGTFSESANATTRAGQVLSLLDSDLRALERVFEVEIVEARQAGADTVEIIYRHPGHDGLVGLRRDVSEQVVDLPVEDPHHALAVNENSPREMATMLRIELEEPLPRHSLRADADGVLWWGHPASQE